MSVDVPSKSRTGAMGVAETSASHNRSAAFWINSGSMLITVAVVAAAAAEHLVSDTLCSESHDDHA
jgi:hypothetical protein